MYSLTLTKKSEIKVKKSRFIAILKNCYSEKEFKSWLSQTKKDFYDASHVCWAYRIYRKSRLNEFSSDSGEPRGTAGKPMLKILKQNNLIQITAVVARYFGGSKLGKKGLIDAYELSVKNLIDKSNLVEWVDMQYYNVICPMKYCGNLSNCISTLNVEIVEDRSSINLDWIIKVKFELINVLRIKIKNITKGEGKLIKYD